MQQLFKHFANWRISFNIPYALRRKNDTFKPHKTGAFYGDPIKKRITLCFSELKLSYEFEYFVLITKAVCDFACRIKLLIEQTLRPVSADDVND